MASWTAVRVRLRGRFCFWVLRLRAERLGRGRMRREARIRTWRSENFFSSSRVRLCYSCQRQSSKEEGLLVWRFILPLLDAVETGQGRDGDKDDNSLLAVADFDLIETRKVSMRAPGQSLGPLPVLFLRSQFVRRHGGRRPSPTTARPYSGEPLGAQHGAFTRGVELGGRRRSREPLYFVHLWEQDLKRRNVLSSFGLGKTVIVFHTSRAETNCRGRRATLRSAVLVSRSKRA